MTKITATTIENTLSQGLALLRKRVESGEFVVKVGVPDVAKTFTDADGSVKTTDEVSLADVAKFNEFGTERMMRSASLASVTGEDSETSVTGTPARPAFRTAVSKNIVQIQRINAANLRLILLGRKTIGQALNLLGAYVAGQVKFEIVHGKWEPNAPSTIDRKGSSKPLINTAQLKNSVGWEVIGG